jgi:ABC-2 type transport system ATP-binding protein
MHVTHGAAAGQALSEKSVQAQFLAITEYSELESVADCHSALVEALQCETKVALRVQALSKCYGTIKVLAGVSFDIHQGEILGLLGSNGAGKTTLVSILATGQRPSAGDALILGRSIRDERRAVRRVVGLASQEIALYPMLTAAENLHFFGRIYGLGGVELSNRVKKLLGFVGLENRANDRIETYSGGMKRRLNLAVALVHGPQLLLLDEPTAGVDPQSREDILKLVRRLRDDGKAVLYTTHHMDEAETLCDRLCILNEGALVAVGTFEGLLHNLDFSEVIELRGLPVRTDLAAIRAVPGLCRVERRKGLVRLFVKRAADFLEPLQKIIARDSSVRLQIVPISLELLFLHLTGREAR